MRQPRRPRWLRGQLEDARSIEAAVFQSLLGPTEVTIACDGDEVVRQQGFVA